ncbi:MAG: helix-turn-helix transcriptional regulator [Negativicutes bacterium]|nr:helix-turn-helix transcriptional regulator [Negativicutes bacterium]
MILVFDNIYVKRIRFQKLRRQLKISLRSLAEITGISYDKLREIENRQRQATERELLAIAVAFHMSAEDIGVLRQMTLW